jgi:hypothetical protein
MSNSIEDTLLAKILRLCKGDTRTAKSLVMSARKTHPNQEPIWYLQKVIGDLERLQAEAFQRKRQGQTPPPPPPNAALLQPKQAEPLHQALYARKTQLEQAKSQPQRSQPKPLKIDWFTENRLHTLCNGDMKTVHRLIESARNRYPDRDDKWVCEKVIYDLERDRR